MREAALAAPPGPVRRRLPRLLRQVHKWTGLVLGLQLILWCLSGAVMALIDKDAVQGPAPAAVPASFAGLAPVPGSADSLALRSLAGRPVYEIGTAGGLRLLDARTLEPVAIDAAGAEAIARAAWPSEAPLRRVVRLDRPNLEARAHDGPVWRIDLEAPGNPSLYVHAVSGRSLVRRTDAWRAWDVAWMLHNMDYAARSSFNHPLIVIVTFGTLWLAISGVWLLFHAFRRRQK